MQVHGITSGGSVTEVHPQQPIRRTPIPISVHINVTLVVDNVNCRDSITHQVIILPIPPIANFDSIPSGCSPLYVSINNTSLNTEIPGTTYRWDFGDGSYSTAKNPTYTYFTAGSYVIELTVTGPGGVSTYSQVVNAYPCTQGIFRSLLRRLSM